MKLEIEESAEQAILHVSGELSILNNDRLRKAISDEMAKGGVKTLVLDLANVRYVDSSGLSTLIAGFRECRDHTSEFILTGVHGKLAQLLHNTRLDSVFTIRNLSGQHL